MESHIDLKDLTLALEEVEASNEVNNTTAIPNERSAATPTLTGLPVEIRLHIFSLVDAGATTTIRVGETCAYCAEDPSHATLVAVSRTCKQFYAEVNDE